MGAYHTYALAARPSNAKTALTQSRSTLAPIQCSSYACSSGPFTHKDTCCSLRIPTAAASTSASAHAPTAYSPLVSPSASSTSASSARPSRRACITAALHDLTDLIEKNSNDNNDE
ncbi:hypothetical protein K469DRAFT_682639 [Zopfia rhizophila CBS 207.26]|uniref:Uncharacterized protein n=1 Tax=Zopfia rhizophila CBS 207.26 TaxID=1314779 RepID=A0A6A6DFF0_9PEZI|nr:hypothetical protein K469DRAFT_682639 [Zopfia rhizophila CBS 207.26]